MKKHICVVTATRAEYGLLSPLIKRMLGNSNFQVSVVATGAHLSPEFGLTYKEIEKDGIKIDKKIEILLSADTSTAISKSMGLAMISFSEYFEESKPDAVLILGDRYEMLAVACTAMNERIPIIHLYGGETTEGAVDEAIRHAITKMSYLHFTSTEEYRKRVIQLGENPKRVFCTGALGIENILQVPVIERDKLQEALGFSLKEDYALVTFHPVTLEEDGAEREIIELLSALDHFKGLSFIFTKANADEGGRIINYFIDKFVKARKNAVAFESLGMVRYLNAVRYSKMVIGNSSSGLIEAPSFHIPTINIGDRQRGRIKAESVIDCSSASEEIINAVKFALSDDFQEKIKTVKNPYGNGMASKKIMDILIEQFCNKTVELKKKFYDM